MISHPKIKLHTFQSRAEMIDALTTRTLEDLQHDINQQGVASWAVSGGSTPKPLFETIAKANIPWEKVQIALVDERWVPRSHARSNEAFVKNSLLTHRAAAASFTRMFQNGLDHKSGVEKVEEAYQHLAQPFTSLLLGIGNDGHTASLFPEADGLETAISPSNINLCAALTAKKSNVTGDEIERTSLTFHAINIAKNRILMITGDEKMETLSRALTNDTNLPIARVINAMNNSLDVFWAP